MTAERPTIPATDGVADDVRKLCSFVDFVRHAPVSSGVCYCGDEMDRHSDPMSCGHSPVDQWDHSLSQWLEEIEPILNRAARPAEPRPAAVVEVNKTLEAAVNHG